MSVSYEPTKESYMRRCIALAQNGRQHAAPNPMVGAVIVHRDAAGRERIIGEGFHTCCGKAHAEVNAIHSVRPEDRPLLKESTIYVSLEPCAHFGRTPPCASLIIKTGIPRVVVGCVDPFAKVGGRGIRMMREAGLEVEVGCLEAECLEINRRFITAQRQRRPFITLKWARSADGFIAAWNAEPQMMADLEEEIDLEVKLAAAQNAPLMETVPVRLSTPHSLMRVHRLRAEHQAILVGHATLRTDHPTLNVRYWVGQDPIRVVLGRVGEDELPVGFRAFADVQTMLADLFREGVQSLLVEGGRATLQSFIDEGLWDEAYVEYSATQLGSGVPEPRMPVGVCIRFEQAFDAMVAHYENK